MHIADALWAPARARSSGFHSNPTIVRRPDGAGAVTLCRVGGSGRSRRRRPAADTDDWPSKPTRWSRPNRRRRCSSTVERVRRGLGRAPSVKLRGACDGDEDPQRRRLARAGGSRPFRGVAGVAAQGCRVRLIERVSFRYDVERYGETLEEVVKTSQFTVPVVVNGKRILRTRAKFDCPWSVVGVADVDEELVDKAKLTAWLAVGGRRIGLGDWRPEKSGAFGRFDVAGVVELADAAAAARPSRRGRSPARAGNRGRARRGGAA